MRTLLLFRGAPGCGKSTYIKEHDLEKYTLSADTIRLMCQGVRKPRLTQWKSLPRTMMLSGICSLNCWRFGCLTVNLP